MTHAERLMGKKLGFLTVIGSERIRNRTYCIVRCDCGTIKKVPPVNLDGVPRPTKSCGCMRLRLLSAGQWIHGASIKNKAAPEFRTFICWQSMLWRCYNKARKDYPRYGGRGISVCERWKTNFENFLADMGLKPMDRSIGRINNDGNYEPGNCRWETPKEQARNKVTNHLLTLGSVTFTIAEWAERTGLSKSTIEHRLKAGWTEEKTLTEPARGLLRVAFG